MLASCRYVKSAGDLSTSLPPLPPLPHFLICPTLLFLSAPSTGRSLRTGQWRRTCSRGLRGCRRAPCTAPFGRCSTPPGRGVVLSSAPLPSPVPHPRRSVPLPTPSPSSPPPLPPTFLRPTQPRHRPGQPCSPSPLP